MKRKILILGVDGMDPRLTKKFMNEGKLPHIQQFVQRGAAREDLVLLGALPTITPPLWTTLSTGAYPGTHGITCFWNQHPQKIDTLVFAFDSRQSKAEPLWNVFTEAGRKTLVWHWPGASWPPTSDNPLLSVVDGTQPSNINVAVGTLEWEKLFHATEAASELVDAQFEENNSGAGCIITDIGDLASAPATKKEASALTMALTATENVTLLMSEREGECVGHGKPAIMTETPIHPAAGWASVPADAKEFSVLVSDGRLRRICLLLKNEDGVYDRIAVYHSKKDAEPLFIIHNDEYLVDIEDELIVQEQKRLAPRCYLAFKIAPDGSEAYLYFSSAMDQTNDTLFHPKSLLAELTQHVGCIKPVSLRLCGEDNIDVKTLCHITWEAYTAWQSACLRYLIDNDGYEVVFSHLHNVDCLGHQHWEQSHQSDPARKALEAPFQALMERAYVDTDKYLGDFLPYLDKGWTIFLVSDHGLICKTEEIPALGDPFGINIKIMTELGYTVLQKDEQGNPLKAIDWNQTRALAPRGNHIYLNLKGRDEHGIVEPCDRYQLEEEIISALYSYRWNGRRIVSLAMRNKEAALLGLGGPYCGDILYWLTEGPNRIHGDSLSTYYGYADTSVSPIFIAAGSGIKAGYTTKRVIRQVDVAATIAALGGVRMPAQCEGAPIYQILAD